MRTDRLGNYIPDFGNCDYWILNFPGTDIQSEVNFSEKTESVYVRYSSSKTHRCVTCRFSWHVNNAVLFGDQLDGRFASEDEILYRLGYKKREFLPDTRLWIASQKVAKKRLHLYEEAPLSIQEMYALGEDADLSEYKGKLARGGNYLILGDKVEKVKETGRDWLGREVVYGTYIYSDID